MAIQRPVDGDAEIGKPPLPFQQAVAVGYRQRKMMRAANARRATRRPWPFKKGDGRARASGGVAKVEMVASRIIEIHGLLDEPQSQDLRVEVNRALSFGADQRDVMQSLDSHLRASWLAQFYSALGYDWRTSKNSMAPPCAPVPPVDPCACAKAGLCAQPSKSTFDSQRVRTI